jgi:hypothetical protein
MNLYRVVSEELSVVVPVLDTGEGPREYGCIAATVAARTAVRAKWLAWETDRGPLSFKTYTGYAGDMPHFEAALVYEGVDFPEGVYELPPPACYRCGADGDPGTGRPCCGAPAAAGEDRLPGDRYVYVFRQLDDPGREPGVAWRAELHTDDDSPPFPLAAAYLSDFRAAPVPLGMIVDYVWVPDHLRRRGHATRLIRACERRWPGLTLTGPISEAGEGLIAKMTGGTGRDPHSR